MQTVHKNSSRLASRRLERAITLLNRRQLDGASHASPDRFYRDRLCSLATELREFTLPLSRGSPRTFIAGGSNDPLAESLGNCHPTALGFPQKKAAQASHPGRRAVAGASTSPRVSGRALDLPEIMALGIAQHGARLNELRLRAFVIENEMERDSEGRVLSRYWLRFDPERDGTL